MKKFILIVVFLSAAVGFGAPHGCTHQLLTSTPHPVHVWVCPGTPVSSGPVKPS